MVESNTNIKKNEAIERKFEIPNFTIKELRDAVPKHCFERDTLRSMYFVAHDFTLISILFYLATFINTFQWLPVRMVMWVAYWICQGVVCTGVWVLAHECGHGSFSSNKNVNNIMGLIMHSFLLVPYHSWRISHSQHHKNTGSMEKEVVFIPLTRKQSGLPSKSEDTEGDGPHSIFEESPILIMLDIVKVMLLGWPAYILVNATGRAYPEKWTSHFNPFSLQYTKNQFWDVVLSVVGVSVTISFLVYFSNLYGSATVINYYVIPYLFVNFWLVLITYLQHTDPKLPHYREGLWNFQRGALLAVDRSYGILNYFHHNIADTHVVHHLFSTMPHYHAKEATEHIKKHLGKHYISDNTPIARALWRSWIKCRFVEDEGDIVFFKY
ncbi:hypothetical protein DLAC_05959 [Tieghemostelium lacteum]|uniref:Fatty acid desaturase domain-containing protein n=1 Tax=Tieghemostelium lacteum TaxID=361077 RepID=A0A151ZHB0_TIELA|nr:hypothetical protein DLAC_05959 [Tieghemostelium lacteum]|eukprot:KYQ93295.1 hypothetical protein DLAC_05959 [Tieghemostelium lacteum]